MATKAPRKGGRRPAQPEAQSDQSLPDSSADERRRARIAERAYYNAERRGFQGGTEEEDWLEAERQIDSEAAAGGIQSEASRMADGADDVSAPAIEQERTADGGDGIIEPDRVKEWAKALNVSAPKLREAIKTVGPKVDDVKQFLGAKKTSRRENPSYR